jgi:putative transposase
VSSHAQRNDLISQVEAMDKFCVSNGVIVSDRIQEIGGGLNFKQPSWSLEGIKASDSQRLDAIKKVLSSYTMELPEYAWMKKYPSTVYQSAFIDLKNAVSRWRKGLGKFPVKKTKKKEILSQFTKLLAFIPKKESPHYLLPIELLYSQGKS